MDVDGVTISDKDRQSGDRPSLSHGCRWRTGTAAIVPTGVKGGRCLACSEKRHFNLNENVYATFVESGYMHELAEKWEGMKIHKQTTTPNAVQLCYSINTNIQPRAVVILSESCLRMTKIVISFLQMRRLYKNNDGYKISH
ncbi:hypothetical protein CBL_02840 [Carabus blaptoides fortunei]